MIATGFDLFPRSYLALAGLGGGLAVIIFTAVFTTAELPFGPSVDEQACSPTVADAPASRWSR